MARADILSLVYSQGLIGGTEGFVIPIKVYRVKRAYDATPLLLNLRSPSLLQ